MARSLAEQFQTLVEANRQLLDKGTLSFVEAQQRAVKFRKEHLTRIATIDATTLRHAAKLPLLRMKQSSNRLMSDSLRDNGLEVEVMEFGDGSLAFWLDRVFDEQQVMSHYLFTCVCLRSFETAFDGVLEAIKEKGVTLSLMGILLLLSRSELSTFRIGTPNEISEHFAGDPREVLFDDVPTGMKWDEFIKDHKFGSEDHDIGLVVPIDDETISVRSIAGMDDI